LGYIFPVAKEKEAVFLGIFPKNQLSFFFFSFCPCFLWEYGYHLRIELKLDHLKREN